MMKNIFIYPNLRKDSARDILQPVCDQLRRDGVRLMLPKQMRVVPPIIEDADYMKTEDAVQFADMAVVLGGDGTMLRLAREAAQNQLPLLGINVGHVGFMTELEPAELPKMEKLFTDEFSLDSRMMLHVAVQRGGRIVYENDALNDIVIAKGTAFRVVRVGISADNEEVTRFNGDGVIAATPTGSTAYNLSAGGPILSPTMEAVVITPICPHSFNKRSVVVSSQAEICVKVEKTRESYVDEASVRCDGEVCAAIETGDVIRIQKAELPFNMVCVGEIGFYQKMRSKLNRT